MSIEKKGWINHDYKNQIQLTYCTLIILLISYYSRSKCKSNRINDNFFIKREFAKCPYPIQIPAITNENLKQ